VDAEEKPPAEKPPVLSYSSIPRPRRGRNFDLAMGAALLFTAWSLLFGGMLTIAATLWENSVEDMFTGIMVELFLGAVLFFVCTISCLFRIAAAESPQLVRRKRIWIGAGIYTFVGMAVGLISSQVSPSNEGGVSLAAALWWISVPMFSGLYVLRPTTD
jgi:hypothetical protein